MKIKNKFRGAFFVAWMLIVSITLTGCDVSAVLSQILPMLAQNLFSALGNVAAQAISQAFGKKASPSRTVSTPVRVSSPSSSYSTASPIRLVPVSEDVSSKDVLNIQRDPLSAIQNRIPSTK